MGPNIQTHLLKLKKTNERRKVLFFQKAGLFESVGPTIKASNLLFDNTVKFLLQSLCVDISDETATHLEFDTLL